MNKSKTVAFRLDLGQTRVAGFTIYDGINKEFNEKTPKEVKDLIKKNEINGLRLINDEIELDSEGFGIHNLMVKSAVGKFRTLYPTNSHLSCFYSVVRVIETDRGRLYETISNQCARVKVTEERLRMLYAMIGFIGGVKMNDKGDFAICEGVFIEDKRTNKAGQVPVAKDTEVKKPASLEAIFDKLDVTEISASTDENSEDTAVLPDNTVQNASDGLPPEHVENKKIDNNPKNKKK